VTIRGAGVQRCLTYDCIAGATGVRLATAHTISRFTASTMFESGHGRAGRAGAGVALDFTPVRATAGPALATRVPTAVRGQHRVVVGTFGLAAEATVCGHVCVHGLTGGAAPWLATSRCARFLTPCRHAFQMQHTPTCAT
jgi:hypothetical protein